MLQVSKIHAHGGVPPNFFYKTVTRTDGFRSFANNNPQMLVFCMEKHLRRLQVAWLGILILLSAQGFAQAPNSAPAVDFYYEMVQSSGTNGSAVAWDSKNSVYVTVIAGNAEFPREVFGPQGEATADNTAGFDWRGLWYNPSNGKLEGNGAGDSGWAAFTIDDGEWPGDVKVIEQGEYQPSFQSVGAYDYEKKMVVYLDYDVDGLTMYSRKNPKKTKSLNLGWDKDCDMGNINSTTVGFTGHKGYEYVLLDYNNGRLAFFNRNGKHTATAQLPEDAPLNDAFAFSFANDRAFLYNKQARIWYAYKIF
jgi:hypothetical protein